MDDDHHPLAHPSRTVAELVAGALRNVGAVTDVASIFCPEKLDPIGFPDGVPTLKQLATVAVRENSTSDYDARFVVEGFSGPDNWHDAFEDHFSDVIICSRCDQAYLSGVMITLWAEVREVGRICDFCIDCCYEESIADPYDFWAHYTPELWAGPAVGPHYLSDVYTGDINAYLVAPYSASRHCSIVKSHLAWTEFGTDPLNANDEMRERIAVSVDEGPNRFSIFHSN